jgi:hypothetical protein
MSRRGLACSSFRIDRELWDLDSSIQLSFVFAGSSNSSKLNLVRSKFES